MNYLKMGLHLEGMAFTILFVIFGKQHLGHWVVGRYLVGCYLGYGFEDVRVSLAIN